MTTPMVGIGHDIVLGLLEVIRPIPQHGSIQIAERNYGIAPAVHDQGNFVVLHWDVINQESDYINILDLFGLLVDKTSNVTVYVKNERFQWTLYNGTAFLPEIGQDAKWSNYFIRDLNLYVCDLETFS